MTGVGKSSLERVWSAVRQCGLATKCYAADATVCADCPFANSRVLLDLCRSGEGADDETVDTASVPGVAVKAGQTIIAENDPHNQIFVVLSGWGFRYKTHADGRRLILDHMLPGDVLNLSVGLSAEDGRDARAFGPAGGGSRDHGIDALTDVELCAIPGDRLATALRVRPELAVDLLQIKQRQNRILEQNMYFIGGQKPSQRVASILLQLYDRAAPVGLAANDEILLPFTQQHLGEATALSQVHMQRTLKQLAELKLATWNKGLVTIHDRLNLEKFADWSFQKSGQRSLACSHCFMAASSA